MPPDAWSLPRGVRSRARRRSTASPTPTSQPPAASPTKATRAAPAGREALPPARLRPAVPGAPGQAALLRPGGLPRGGAPLARGATAAAPAETARAGGAPAPQRHRARATGRAPRGGPASSSAGGAWSHASCASTRADLRTARVPPPAAGVARAGVLLRPLVRPGHAPGARPRAQARETSHVGWTLQARGRVSARARAPASSSRDQGRSRAARAVLRYGRRAADLLPFAPSQWRDPP